MCRNIEAKGEEGWEDLKAESPEGKRQILQALNVDGQLGGKLRQKMERLVRESLRQHKEAKKKPNGDFVKLLITHTGWNATDIRGSIREPGVCKVHPDPTAAERIWVCERNVPPIGSWLLNYTAMEDEELDAKTREAVENWEEEEGEKEPQAQKRDNCGCFTTVINPEEADVWKGHICTAEVRKFNSPLVRALLRKGHAFKLSLGEETLLMELSKGLDGYIEYKTKCKGDTSCTKLGNKPSSAE